MNLLGLVLNHGPQLIIGRNSGSHIPTLEDQLDVSRIQATLSYHESIGFALKNDSERGIGGKRANGSTFYLKQGEILVLEDGDKFSLADYGYFVYTAQST